VSLPLVTEIGNAFQNTGGTALTLTLGSTPPRVADRLFEGVSVSKTVKVKRPSSASGAYTGYANALDTTIDNWANAFRGGGWNGTTYGTTPSYVNTNVTVSFENSDI
jgi:hypothetical protein